MKEEFRRLGLGSHMWQLVVNDCLTNHGSVYMQWAVLNWNTPAIEFYLKFNSINLSESEQQRLSVFRYTTEKIYANQNSNSV